MEEITIKNVVDRSRGKGRIINTYATEQYYRNYNKVRPRDKIYKLGLQQFRTIFKIVNEYMKDQLLTTGMIHLHKSLGHIYIVKRTFKPHINKDNKLEYKAPVNWGATLKLWVDDPESRITKTLVRLEPGDMYQFKYKNPRIYDNRDNKNIKLYKFSIVRSIKQELCRKIRNKESIAHFNFKTNG